MCYPINSGFLFTYNVTILAFLLLDFQSSSATGTEYAFLETYYCIFSQNEDTFLGKNI